MSALLSRLTPTLLAAIAFLRPVPEQGVDYAALPPAPADLHAALARSGTSIAKACEIAEKTSGGLASSARFLSGDTGLIRVETYTASEHHQVDVHVGDGTVAANRVLPRFPGEPVEGDWKTSPGGVRYWDLQVGTGEAPPDPGARVKVHYTGWLTDGTQFDSTREKNQPIVRECNRLIPGWTETLLAMKAGGRRKIIVPPELGYGARGYPPFIPPNATLIFDIELVEVLPPAPQRPPR